MILMGISFSILNYYSTARGLIEAKHRLGFWQQKRYSIGLLMYFVGTALSFVDARIALIIFAGMALYYVVEPLTASQPTVRADRST